MDKRKVAEYLNSVEGQLNKQGWELGDTGGGCTAYTRTIDHPNYPDDWYWMLTKADDPIAPDDAQELVLIGLYDDDGQSVTMLTAKLMDLLDGSLTLQVA